MDYVKSTNCGYCHGKKREAQSWALESISMKMEGKGYSNNCSLSNGIVDEMSLKEYEDQIKDGWRRSGTYMYKPDLLRSCCRQYTIRTNYDMFVNNGHFTHNTRKTLRKFYNKFNNPSCGNGKSLLETYLTRDRGDDFYTVLLPNTFSMDKYELYKKYQIHVHNDKEDDVNEEGFWRFLCDDPFKEDVGPIDWLSINREWSSISLDNYKDDDKFENLKKLRGPIHECYIINGELAAISVLDILPDGISSVYFIWDPKHANLGLGTISALREIVMTQILNKSYYYLGFFIPDCSKMVYKGKYGGEIRNFTKMKTPKWVSLETAMKCESFKEGRFVVFDNEGKDVAESMYGVDIKDNDKSLVIVNKPCLFPKPRVIPC